MPTPVGAARQCLTEEAARALDDAVVVARRRSHAQTTSLHAVSALLSLPSSALRDACTRANSSAYTQPLKFRALELCVGVSLDRLPSAKAREEPPVSNSLMAAIKRSQANQRRHPESFHLHQIHSQQQTASLLKVELKNFILSILDDPIVSRVLGDAGFRSCDIKLAIVHPPVTQSNRFSRALVPPIFLCNLTDPDPARMRFPFPLAGIEERGDENCKRIGEVLVRKSGKNPLLIGVNAAEALGSFMTAVQKGKLPLLPPEVSRFGVVTLEKEIAEFVVEGGSEEKMSSKLKEVSHLAEQCSGDGAGVIVNFGEVKALVAEGVVSDALSFVVVQLKELVEMHSGKLWLIGAGGSNDMYMKLLARFPAIEKDWDLHLLPISSSKASVDEVYSKSSLLGSFVPLAGFFSGPSDFINPLSITNQSFICCHLCTEKYEQEVASIRKDGSAITVGDQCSTSSPSWLQMTELDTGKGVDLVKTKADSTTLSDTVSGLQRKWNDICRKIHHAQSFPNMDNCHAGSHGASPEGSHIAADRRESSGEDSSMQENRSAKYLCLQMDRQKSFLSKQKLLMQVASDIEKNLTGESDDEIELREDLRNDEIELRDDDDDDDEVDFSESLSCLPPQYAMDLPPEKDDRSQRRRSPPRTLSSAGKSRPLPDQKHLATRSATSASTITMDDDMDNEQGRFFSADKEPEGLPDELKGLSMYFSLFPSDYEFRRDELVQMWMAEGFIDESQRKTTEDIGCAYFNSLEKIGFLVPSRRDFSMDFDSVCSLPSCNPGKLLFKVNPIKLSELNTTAPVDYFAAAAGSLDGDLELTQHLSLNCKDIDQMTFGILKNFKHLRTLLLLSGHESSVKHIPRDLFLSLKDLRTLNLSRTLISEVPSSIRNMKSLRYLDLSNTRITQLPESIDSLRHLQTIKLRGCVHFLQLPKGMKKLINLRHMDLDIIRQLRAMPPFLGNLTSLLTLSAFLVGREEGCRIGELQNLNNLRGVLRISRLENVSDKDEAKEAALINKQYLQRLELRWSNVFIEKIEEQKKILDCLQPHAGLKELQIQHYAGSTLPTWISHPSLASLVVLTLYRCINCQLLPCIGQLQMLKSLSIIEMNEVKEINHQFYGDGLVDQAFHAFPKLEILEVDIMFNLKEWKEVKTGDFASLLKLTMDSCPELDSLPSLSWLKSLKHLEFRRCPKLLSLPSDGLPTSLESFIVIDCPELKEWCRKVEGDDWSKIYHVPSIWFDCEEVRSKSYRRPGTSGEISEVNME